MIVCPDNLPPKFVRLQYPLMPSQQPLLWILPIHSQSNGRPLVSMHVVQSASPFLALQRREFHRTLSNCRTVRCNDSVRSSVPPFLLSSLTPYLGPTQPSVPHPVQYLIYKLSVTSPSSSPLLSRSPWLQVNPHSQTDRHKLCTTDHRGSDNCQDFHPLCRHATSVGNLVTSVCLSAGCVWGEMMALVQYTSRLNFS